MLVKPPATFMKLMGVITWERVGNKDHDWSLLLQRCLSTVFPKKPPPCFCCVLSGLPAPWSFHLPHLLARTHSPALGSGWWWCGWCRWILPQSHTVSSLCVMKYSVNRSCYLQLN